MSSGVSVSDLETYLSLEVSLKEQLLEALYSNLDGTFKLKSFNIHGPASEIDAGMSGLLVTSVGVEYRYWLHMPHPKNLFKVTRGLVLERVSNIPFYCEFGHRHQRVSM